jgi:hypothetical protein
VGGGRTQRRGRYRRGPQRGRAQLAPAPGHVARASPRDRRWSFDNVVDTLLEALEAAKLRAVDPDVLVAYGHQMPAIYPPDGIDSGPQEASGG